MSKIRITRLELIKFGKFADYSIDISDGMNVIYGDNEAGKSTIQLFIKFMLFGIPSRGGKREKIKDREKIIPWQDNKAAGRNRNIPGVQKTSFRRYSKSNRQEYWRKLF